MTTPPVARRSIRRASRGLTMVELLVVLAILAALGGVVLMNVGDRHGDLGTATRATLENVLRACERYFADTNEWPECVGDLLQRPPGAEEYDPATRTGWNGPYLHATGARYRPDPSAGFSTAYARTANDPELADPKNDLAVLDAWQAPLVLQQSRPDAPYNHDRERIRLVSAGRDGILQTANDADGSNGGSGRDDTDDLVLFLDFPDPLIP